MSHRRRHRLTTTLLVVLSLLFSQLALAAYVCPQRADAMTMAGMPCDGMDSQQPALCHQHAADPGQTFEAVKLPVASQPALVQMLVLPLASVADAARAMPTAAAAEVRPPPDQLFLSTLRLRV